MLRPLRRGANQLASIAADQKAKAKADQKAKEQDAEQATEAGWRNKVRAQMSNFRARLRYGRTTALFDPGLVESDEKLLRDLADFGDEHVSRHAMIPLLGIKTLQLEAEKRVKLRARRRAQEKKIGAGITAVAVIGLGAGGCMYGLNNGDPKTTQVVALGQPADGDTSASTTTIGGEPETEVLIVTTTTLLGDPPLSTTTLGSGEDPEPESPTGDEPTTPGAPTPAAPTTTIRGDAPATPTDPSVTTTLRQTNTPTPTTTTQRGSTPVVTTRNPTTTTSTTSTTTTSTTTTTTTTTIQQNRGPVANNDTINMGFNSQAGAFIVNNDTDADGDVLTIVSVTQPGRGRVELGVPTLGIVFHDDLNGPGDGTLLQTTFTYTISDPSGATSSATVTVSFREPRRD